MTFTNTLWQIIKGKNNMYVWYGNHFKYVQYLKPSGKPKFSSGYETLREAKEAKRNDKDYTV